ncbi:hypothetical protein ACNR9Q_08815 [Maribacter sp. X9]|uniref:hypothetical protein n=1 Tax=Maribacter sp. X9 TaxID=3402159 RepID=UPI003AF33A36
MKTIATIIFIIFLGFTAQAQNTSTDVKVETTTTSIVAKTTYNFKIDKATEVARLYKFKNALIKKELNFLTKTDKPKMA